MSSRPLDGLVAVEVSGGYAAGLCGRLLQQHGAEVVRVTTDRPDGVDRATRLWLDQGKRVIDAASFDQRLAADIVIVDLAPADARGVWDPERLSRERPRAIVCSITPFGESGPWRDYRADALTLDALAGTFLLRGPADRPPVSLPRYVAELAGGLTAYNGIIAALLQRARGLAEGELVDVSLFESVLGFAELSWSAYAYLGRLSSRGAGNGVLGMMPCSNGYCEGYLWGADGWRTFGALIGDEKFHTLANTRDQGDATLFAQARERASGWFEERTKQQAFADGQEVRLHFGYSATIADLLTDPQIVARGSLATLEIDGKPLQMPNLPFSVACSVEAGTPVQWTAQRARPLSGVTIVDLTIFWAGPLAARLLADLGANVIKVEGLSRPDPIRNQLPKDGVYDDAHKWERGWWNGLNVGKRSLALELGRPGARALLLGVVAKADVVFENFSRRVLPNFKLDWPNLQQVSDSLSLVSSSAFGRTGPYQDYIAFGSNLEPLTGITELAGYADGTPESVGANVCDPIAGLACAGSLLTVLLHRLRFNAAGVQTEITQRDVLISALPWAFAEYQLDHVLPTRNGNQRADTFVHDCFPCAGFEQYVAVSCPTAQEYDGLCRLIGFVGESARGGTDPNSGDSPAAFRAALAAWCRERSKFAVFQALQSAGIAAAPLLDAREIDTNPQLAARGFFRTIETAAGFEQRAMTYGFRFLRHPLELNDRASRFGEHNAEILRWAGFGDDQIAEAARNGVIGDRPTADFVSTAPATQPAT